MWWSALGPPPLPADLHLEIFELVLELLLLLVLELSF